MATITAPILNPLRLWPLTELNPRTDVVDYVRARPYYPGEGVPVMLVASDEGAMFTTEVWAVRPDGTRVAAGGGLTSSRLGGRTYGYGALTVPDEPCFHFQFEARWNPAIGSAGNRVVLASCPIVTTADRSRLVRLDYAADNNTEHTGIWWPDRGGFKPFLYVEGGFFTSGFSPSIDDDDYLTQDYVSRYTHAHPRLSRTLTLGGARGIENDLAATVNAALCLPDFRVDGVPFVRFDGAGLEPLGDASLPLRSWAVALQGKDGDLAVDVTEGTADDVKGTVLDASGRYVVDASGRYVNV